LADGISTQPCAFVHGRALSGVGGLYFCDVRISTPGSARLQSVAEGSLMKTPRICLLATVVGLLVVASGLAQDAAPSTPVDQVSYIIGRQIGDSLSGEELANELNLDVLCSALREAAAKKPGLIPPDKAQEIMQAFGARMQEKVGQVRAVQGEVNKKEGADFLAANKAAEGWKTTGSGLQYKVVKDGDGAKPALTDVVEVNYRGTLLDGTEFDSSYKRGKPAVFPVRQVIKGWQEALQMMPVGSTWDLVIPADLAYGDQGKGREIAPDAVLKFEVELLAIKDAKAMAPPAMPMPPAPPRK
jgi:FKBP-type peptidyl-prolyl cis-trans isomerase